jgi:hypothetical protein
VWSDYHPGGLIFLALTKILAMSLTISSGGSGGVFGPNVYGTPIPIHGGQGNLLTVNLPQNSQLDGRSIGEVFEQFS